MCFKSYDWITPRFHSVPCRNSTGRFRIKRSRGSSHMKGLCGFNSTESVLFNSTIKQGSWCWRSDSYSIPVSLIPMYTDISHFSFMWKYWNDKTNLNWSMLAKRKLHSIMLRHFLFYLVLFPKKCFLVLSITRSNLLKRNVVFL